MTVSVTYHGGAGEVTGSCIHVQCGRARFLVDCGMFQGGAEADRKNARPFPVPPSSVDFIVSTHAHLDHSGLMPKIVHDGFRGPIYATPATADLLGVMLPDAGHIQEREAEWKERKNDRGGKRAAPPLYTEADALAVLPQLKAVPYGETVEPAPGIRVRFLDAGHILGSAIVSMAVRDGGAERTMVFTGDLGHRGLPIVRDPAPVEEADLLAIESTYGNRVHKGMAETIEEFVLALNDTLLRKGGNVVIPAFAVGRAQDILYLLSDLTRQGRLSGLTLYIDSPLAAQATQITLRHPECFDEEMRRAMAWKAENPDGLRVIVTATADESRAINAIRGGAIILAGSGMCDAGRIKHHLRHNLGRKECSIVIVGFQAQGTLGRRIVDGEKRVRIFGEDVAVAADVYTIGGLSAHADRNDLLAWAGNFRRPPRTVLVAHGEESVSREFAKTLSDRFRWNTTVPAPGAPFVV